MDRCGVLPLYRFSIPLDFSPEFLSAVCLMHMGEDCGLDSIELGTLTSGWEL